MLAHNLKNVLELVPEAYSLVKQASVDQESPLDSKDSVLATALEYEYLVKIAKDTSNLNYDLYDKLDSAVHLYGLSEEVSRLSDLMVESANAKAIYESENSTENYLLKVSSFEGSIPYISINDRSTTATNLYKQAKERGITPSEDVILYSGNAYLSKEAAVKALAVRYHTTKNTDFVKLAGSIGRTPDAYLSAEILVDIADTICEMDKVAGLHFQGHNFYKESFFVKEAAYKGSLTLTLCGKQIPYESVERIGRSKISNYIGEDVAKEMDAGPDNFKNVVETLPLDLQKVLFNLVKNV